MVVKMFILFINNFYFTEDDRKFSFQFIGFMHIRIKLVHHHFQHCQLSFVLFEVLTKKLKSSPVR